MLVLAFPAEPAPIFIHLNILVHEKTRAVCISAAPMHVNINLDSAWRRQNTANSFQRFVIFVLVNDFM
jgi:hypothetical protein